MHITWIAVLIFCLVVMLTSTLFIMNIYPSVITGINPLETNLKGTWSDSVDYVVGDVVTANLNGTDYYWICTKNNIDESPTFTYRLLFWRIGGNNNYWSVTRYDSEFAITNESTGILGAFGKVLQIYGNIMGFGVEGLQPVFSWIFWMLSTLSIISVVAFIRGD